MKFLIFVILGFLAVVQAKYLMSPNALSDTMDKLETNELEDGQSVHAAMLTEVLYIPMTRLMSCSNNGCNSVCRALGYNHGRCINDHTCQCYN